MGFFLMDSQMPQGRIVLKAICESKKLANLKTDGARLLYTWLIPNVDVNGCFSADIDVVKGRVFTRLKKSKKVILGYLEDLENNNLILHYEANGDKYLCIPDFKDKQPHINPDREAKTRIPPPTQEQLMISSRVTPTQIEREIESKSKSKYKGKYFEQFWETYPRKQKERATKEAWMKLGVTEQLFKKIMEGLAHWIKSEQWKEPRYIPTPDNFLIEQRWDDEVKEKETMEEQFARIDKKKQEGIL